MLPRWGWGSGGTSLELFGSRQLLQKVGTQIMPVLNNICQCVGSQAVVTCNILLPIWIHVLLAQERVLAQLEILKQEKNLLWNQKLTGEKKLQGYMVSALIHQRQRHRAWGWVCLALDSPLVLIVHIPFNLKTVRLPASAYSVINGNTGKRL